MSGADDRPRVPEGASQVPGGIPEVPLPHVHERLDSARDRRAEQVSAPVVDPVPSETVVLPGVHRGGFRRALTEPVTVAPFQTSASHTGSSPGDGSHGISTGTVQWAPPEPAPLPRSAPWALTFAVLGLAVSLVVGWGFLIGVLGAGLALAALRRPWESRGVAVWALCLSVLSLLYSAGWLWWASTQGPFFG